MAAPSSTTAATDPNNPFRVDSTGKLVVDEQTRLNIEALFARTDAEGLLKAQQEIAQKLPAAAAAEAADLLERYRNYSAAQRQAYPPGVAPGTEEAALAELEGLHALRVAHFGADVAKAFYGADETVTRSLIELMRLEKDQSLTMEEKAARAQQLYDTLPELR
jgi:lipase chaperone LimK